jgi:hypothetical protein
MLELPAAAQLKRVGIRSGSYPSHADFGIRQDSFGQGTFAAPRSHGFHGGIDFAMPVGTEILAPCDGFAFQGHDAIYGLFVKLVCSTRLGQEDQNFYISWLFGHLQEAVLNGPKHDLGSTPKERAESIRMGDRLGFSGKSGNAAAAGIVAHLHLEASLHDNRSAAFADPHTPSHLGSPGASERFLAGLRNSCMVPNRITAPKPSHGSRVDPFLILLCFAEGKPAYERYLGSLPWSRYYSAGAFDVDAGF